jgi:hypothetical protein
MACTPCSLVYRAAYEVHHHLGYRLCADLFLGNVGVGQYFGLPTRINSDRQMIAWLVFTWRVALLALSLMLIKFRKKHA